jgi:hypothetical protein
VASSPASSQICISDIVTTFTNASVVDHKSLFDTSKHFTIILIHIAVIIIQTLQRIVESRILLPTYLKPALAVTCNIYSSHPEHLTQGDIFAAKIELGLIL